MKYVKKRIAIYILFLLMISLFGCESEKEEDTSKNEASTEKAFEECATEIINSLSVEEILVENHTVLQKYAFQWISWKDVSQQLTEDYIEWVSEEGANGRMVYRTVDGVTYILPEYWEGALVDQIGGILLTDEKYKLGCGLQVGMDEDNIDELKIPLRIYVEDETGTGLNNKDAGGIALYNGMNNEDIIEFDYAYSYDEGFVLSEEEQKEKIDELGLPEECYSETHFILIAFVKDEKVSGIFMGIIP
ncbi:MAG: hypothetical protein ACI4EL_10705 [Candidatus Fimimorpha sp.]